MMSMMNTVVKIKMTESDDEIDECKQSLNRDAKLDPLNFDVKNLKYCIRPFTSHSTAYFKSGTCLRNSSMDQNKIRICSQPWLHISYLKSNLLLYITL